MNEARALLERGKANVSEAAAMVGCSSLSHFASLYRKTCGYNPGEIGKGIARHRTGDGFTVQLRG